MHTLKRYPVLFLILVITTMSLLSFKSFYEDKVQPEKIYTQTDRSFYFPGETIWFKSYIVKPNNTVSTISDIMNAELISPKGAVVKNIRLSIENGYAYGDFDINRNWVGGIYTLKVYTNWMRNFSETSFFTKKITVQKVVKPNLLLNLRFEKEGYGKASEVIADFEVKDLKNNPLKHKDITFEVSAKGKKIISNTIITDENGKAKPTFTLPSDIKTTDIVLNVLVPYNGSTESISRSIPVVLDNIDLQFFPESGKIIAGNNNKVAFKALNEFGKPVDVSGDILDDKGAVIKTFKSFHDGMGAFVISAKKNKTYVAKIKTPFISEKLITLPKVHQNGACFSVETDSLKTSITVFSSEKEKLYLQVSNTSKILVNKTIKSSKKGIILNTQDFPIGISKFSLINSGKEVVAERLVFLNAHKKLNVSITLDKTIYQTREQVKATIITTDSNNNPIPSNLSVAVADNKLVSFADDKQDHILSHLLVSSELKGSIHKPSFYFNPKEQKSHNALDFVMLTHGWRNYINKQEVTLENARFKPEIKGIQSGTIIDKKEKPVEANLLLFDNKGKNVLVFNTNAEGKFLFKSAPRTQTTLVAYTENGEKLNIIRNQFKHGFNAEQNESKNEKNSDKSESFLTNNKPLQGAVKQNAMANISLAEDAAALDEVVVIGYGTMKKKELTGAISRISAGDILSVESDLANALQGRVAGVQINQNFAAGASKIMIRGVNTISGNNNPLYVVDGVVYEENGIANIHPSQIESISVLKDAASTSIYGSRGANGVILIQTKNQSFYSNWSKKRLNNAKFNNYAVQTFYNYNNETTYTSKVFYMPKYDSKIMPEERTDFRQTIYWNPVIETNENGKAEFEFYNSDAITSFKITAEGIGFNGLVGRQEKEYATNKLLNIDFKAPNYMALNDTIVLPISITNDTEKSMKTSLNLILPEHLRLLESYTSDITLDANSSIIKNIKIVPIKKAEEITIEVQIKSENFSDTVKRQATILSPYFPIELSISGQKSQSFKFEINDAVKNSIEAEFNVYTDVVGDVMNGIEGLIQKPYGCFEQTSSSTYPNIMVLKYLKESGKSNPEIEVKAMDFIKQGYKRLISFETKEGGFEWFGSTPPHETLTAYGILEFTEMKEVYNKVDQKMIDRTVKWLLNQKDGKGGFDKSKKGYDSFASSPADVANAYIVYALSEAKIDVDFKLEYNTTYNDALKSNDTYKMALLALTSYNLNQPEKATALLNKIKKNIDKHGFEKLPVSNTITRSYGHSKTIETAAFSLLALMREQNTNETLITQGIEYLVSKRNNGRFGSTQSTAMALKALIEYTKSQKQKIIYENDSLELVINGQSFKEKLQMNANGKITLNTISEYLKAGNQTVTVNFLNPKTTFPYALHVTWDSFLPDTSKECPLQLETGITDTKHKVGDNVSLSINVSNTKDEKLGMVTAIIGTPSGTTAQPWQLKEILEQQKVDFYEVFDNYLVFYWREFDIAETKTIRLDLKADIAGSYKAPASTAYLYYGDEFKTWISGNSLEILE